MNTHTLERAISIMGNRDFVPTRELLTRLWPTWLDAVPESERQRAYQLAAKELSRALGSSVKPTTSYSPRPGQRGKYVNGYARADLQAAVSPQPTGSVMEWEAQWLAKRRQQEAAPASTSTLKPYRPVLAWQKRYGMTDQSEAALQSGLPYRQPS